MGGKTKACENGLSESERIEEETGRDSSDRSCGQAVAALWRGSAAKTPQP
jgi:hypothetical protein